MPGESSSTGTTGDAVGGVVDGGGGAGLLMPFDELYDAAGTSTHPPTFKP